MGIRVEKIVKSGQSRKMLHQMQKKLPQNAQCPLSDSRDRPYHVRTHFQKKKRSKLVTSGA